MSILATAYSLEQFMVEAGAFAPDLFLLLTLIAELMVTLFKTTAAPFPLEARPVARRVMVYLLITAGWMLWGPTYNALAASGTLFWVDAFQLTTGLVTTKLALIFFGLFVLAIADPYLKAHRANNYEFGILVGLSLFAMFCVVSAYTLLVLYLSLELQALIFLILLSWHRQSKWALEATLKYLLVNLLASLFFLLALTRCFAAVGSVAYDAIVNFYLPLALNRWSASEGLALLAMDYDLLALVEFLTVADYTLAGYTAIVLALSVSFAFKFGVAPFHLWVPTIYGSGSVPVIALLATASKISYAAALSVLLGYVFYPVADVWQVFYLSVGLTSAWVGNVLLYREQGLLRLVGLSSIASGGYLYVVWAMAPSAYLYPLALMGTIISGLAYCNLFLVMSSTYVLRSDRVAQGVQTIPDLAHLRYSTGHGFLVAGLALSFASLAGIPPLLGFWSKLLTYGTFMFALTAPSVGKIGLILSLMLSGVLGAVGYLRVIAALYFVDTVGFKSYAPIARPLRWLNGVLMAITGGAFVVSFSSLPALAQWVGAFTLSATTPYVNHFFISVGTIVLFPSDYRSTFIVGCVLYLGGTKEYGCHATTIWT